MPMEFSFDCSVCRPGSTLTLPKAIVDVPLGIFPPFKRATCSVVNVAILDNPDKFSEQTCADLRDKYQDDCGCVPDPQSPQQAFTSCTVCEQGKQITLPDTTVNVPLDFINVPSGSIVDGKAFTTCESLDQGLAVSPQGVIDTVCSSLRLYYGSICGCR
jgi:hypothetical protein